LLIKSAEHRSSNPGDKRVEFEFFCETRQKKLGKKWHIMPNNSECAAPIMCGMYVQLCLNMQHAGSSHH